AHAAWRHATSVGRGLRTRAGPPRVSKDRIKHRSRRLTPSGERVVVFYSPVYSRERRSNVCLRAGVVNRGVAPRTKGAGKIDSSNTLRHADPVTSRVSLQGRTE